MTGTIRRVFEPSRVRRGRTATDPVWWVDVENGSKWRFSRKKDALAFVAAGCVCEGHTFLCRKCNGSEMKAASNAFEFRTGSEWDDVDNPDGKHPRVDEKAKDP